MTRQQSGREVDRWSKLLSAEDFGAFRASDFGVRRGFGHFPAVLVIDATYEFVGMPNVTLADSMKSFPAGCGPTGWRAVAAIRKLLDAAVSAAVPIIYTRGQELGGNETTPEPMWRVARERDRENPGLPPRNEIVPPIAPRDSDIVIEKSRPSAFFLYDASHTFERTQRGHLTRVWGKHKWLRAGDGSRWVFTRLQRCSG